MIWEMGDYQRKVLFWLGRYLLVATAKDKYSGLKRQGLNDTIFIRI